MSNWEGPQLEPLEASLAWGIQFVVSELRMCECKQVKSVIMIVTLGL